MSAIHLLNIELEEGIDRIVSLLYSDITTNLPINLTGYTAKLIVKDDIGSPNILLQIENSITPILSSYIFLHNTTGQVDINFKNVLSSTFFSGVYDIILTDPLGSKIKLAKGFILINKSISL